MDFEKYIKAQEENYSKALSEIKSGKKKSHWIWFIFPTIANRFINSEFNIKYAIQNKQEAIEYLNHEILGKRLIEITTELANLPSNKIEDIFPKPDIKKVKASMTLFEHISNNEDVFSKVLEKYFNNQRDEITLKSF